MKFIPAALIALLVGGGAYASDHTHAHGGHSERIPAPEGARVFFISPADGDTVSSPVTFLFGAERIGIAPAGVEFPNTGHHHLLINVALDEIDFDADIPADERHRHFGGGQTMVTLDLPAGTHTFMLLMGDDLHVPHDPPLMSEIITVTVE
jgi:hypothetical protein